MQEVKINGQSVQFPVDVRDISLKQFFQLKQAKDILDEISICTGIARNQIENFKDLKAVQVAQGLLGALSASIAQGFDGITLPDNIFIGMKKIKVPKELRLQPIGAFMSVNDILSDHINKMQADATKQGKTLEIVDINFTDCIPKVLAHYFYLPYHGDDVLYSDLKAEAPEYLEKIMNIPLTQAVPLGNYFFLKYPNLM